MEESMLAPAPEFAQDQYEMAFEFVVEPLSVEQARKLFDAIIALVEAIEPPAYIGGGFRKCREADNA